MSQIFTSHVFDAARALEAYQYSLTIPDDHLALLACSRLRAAVCSLEHAFACLEPDALAEATVLVTHLCDRFGDAAAAGDRLLVELRAPLARLAERA
ncbi:MAG: hypothetical protein ABI867_32745 [Kofleriaceae bacterium]